ncbi:hypothetical protein CMI41_00305 [Candidatus Pacearchaeota archaeon]|nr:hypothetical protein [Candidatus Pacearchaeota archaeon]|tara:strand:+ start:11144 stop:11452 length:309 start_codon:yes stop_codon:yes gene_type:complete
MRTVEEMMEALRDPTNGAINFFDVYSGHEDKGSAAISGEVVYVRIAGSSLGNGKDLVVCKRKADEDPRTDDRRLSSIPYMEKDEDFTKNFLTRVERAATQSQ